MDNNKNADVVDVVLEQHVAAKESLIRVGSEFVATQTPAASNA